MSAKIRLLFQCLKAVDDGLLTLEQWYQIVLWLKLNDSEKRALVQRLEQMYYQDLN